MNLLNIRHGNCDCLNKKISDWECNHYDYNTYTNFIQIDMFNYPIFVRWYLEWYSNQSKVRKLSINENIGWFRIIIPLLSNPRQYIAHYSIVCPNFLCNFSVEFLRIWMKFRLRKYLEYCSWCFSEELGNGVEVAFYKFSPISYRHML